MRGSDCEQGLRGNDGRFINHSCDPNIEVRKYQTMGMASEEYEVGFWAARDIMAGEEVRISASISLIKLMMFMTY